MNIKRISAAAMAAAVLAIAAPMTVITASAEESEPSLTYSINGVEFKPGMHGDYYPAECIPTDHKSYTVKVDIKGNVPKEGYDLKLDTLLFYNEDYTCDMTWTCGGKFQVATDGIVLYRYKGAGAYLNDLLGLGGGGMGLIGPDVTETFSSVSGDIVFEEGNYDHSSEQYRDFLETNNSYLKYLEECINSEYFKDYEKEEQDSMLKDYEELKELGEYQYSWYKLGSDKKSATLDIGKAPAPKCDGYGVVDPAQRHDWVKDQFTEDQIKDHVVMAISSGLDFNFTVTEPGTIELHFKAKDGSSTGGTAVSDKIAGVSVTGVPGAAEVKVSTKKNDNGSYTYDITPVDASGNKVQPAEAAVVGVMLPAELKGKTLNVYRVVDGKYTKMNSWADGDMLFFTTSHFSEFEITTEQRADANPETGSAGMFGLAAVCIAAVGVMLVSRKKK